MQKFVADNILNLFIYYYLFFRAISDDFSCESSASEMSRLYILWKKKNKIK